MKQSSRSTALELAIQRCYPRTVRLMVVLIGVLLVAYTQAATRTWPDVAPCNTTLQACIDGSAASDTVLIAAAAVSEPARINKPFELRAAPGYRPVFDLDAVISGELASGSGNWAVEGLTLRRGYVSVTVNGGGPFNVLIHRMRVLEAISGGAEISVVKRSAVSTGLNYQISENELRYFWDTNDGALRTALQVLDGGAGVTTGRIRENRVIATGSHSIGILISTADRTHRTEILANQVQGGRRGSIYLRQGSVIDVTGGALTALLFNNVITSVVPGSRYADGIKLEILDGSANMRVWHNTISDTSKGVNAVASPGAGPISGSVRGNIFAYIGFAGLTRSGGATALGDAWNLFFQSPFDPSLNKSTIFADPRFRRAPNDAHLRADSPAIDTVYESTLTDVLSAEGLPFTDGDGMRRVKQANGTPLSDTRLDIGALEAGDASEIHRLPASGLSNVSTVDSIALNGIADAYPIATSNWNPDGATGVYDNHPVGLRYFPSINRWVLRQEDLINFAANARFNIFAPGQGTGRFFHANTAANTSGNGTALSASGLNGIADRIVLALRNAGTGSTIAELSAPIAVGFFAPSWRVTRLDSLGMPDIGGFNIYFQEPSINAFRHTASAGNIVGSFTLVDHPILNGNSCARFQITPLSTSGILNNHNTGVFFNSSMQKWAIFNQDFATISNGVEFNVLVDPSIIECAEQYFADGFE